MKSLHAALLLVVIIAVLGMSCGSTRRESFSAQQIEGGLPTIFVSVASYRDEECSKTLVDMFSKATTPSRCHAGVCEQNKVGATFEKCMKAEMDRWSRNVRIVTLDHTQAKGPTYARYVCASLFNGQDYFVQIDSHTRFIQGWDDMMVDMIGRCPTQPCVITHYAPDAASSATTWDAGAPVPVMCDAEFNDDDIPSFRAVLQSARPGVLRPVPFVSCNFWAARGRVLQDVPFDPDLGHLFVGEEQLQSARLWTSGYDFYTPDRSLVSHEYGREGKPKYWNDLSEYRRIQKETLKKVRWILGISAIPPPHPVPERFGLGKKRSIEEYWAYARINLKDRAVDSRKHFCEN